MKLRTLLTLVALSGAAFSTIGCGDDAAVDGAGGAAASTDEQIEELRAEIEALKAALAEASDEEIPALKAALEDAEERLAALETCDNGGDCTGYSDVTSGIRPITDAYCEWVFGCCTDAEVRATVGAAAGDLDGCKEMYGNMFERANVTPVLPGAGALPITGIQLGTAASQVQAGRLTISAKSAKACADMIADSACGDDAPPAAAACGASGTNSCTEMFRGAQAEGEPCAGGLLAQNDGKANECEAGLVCVALTFGPEGVCVRQAEAKDACQKDADCASTDVELYCDEAAGTCKAKPTVGETCAFDDVDLDKVSSLRIPCEGGSYCSPETLKCVDSCTPLKIGDKCINHNDCGEENWCDRDVYPENTYLGECKAGLDAGEVSAEFGTDCRSNSYYTSGSTYCDGLAGDSCAASDQCNSDVCDTVTSNTCLKSCSHNSQCESDEVCAGSYCYAKSTTDGSCSFNAQCPTDQYCNALTCTDRIPSGAACAGQDSCVATDYCDDGTVCTPKAGRPAAAACNEAQDCASGRCIGGTCASALLKDGATCTATGSALNDPCGKGLFCKRTNPETADNAGKCAPQLKTGNTCDRRFNTNEPQCEGNVNCTYNGTTLAYTCPVPVFEATGASESCVLTVFNQVSQ